jgi:hypothetical protein
MAEITDPLNPKLADIVTQSYMKRIIGYTQFYLMFVVLVVGMFGNILSFVIFMKTKKKRTDPSIVYLTSLSLSDNAVIICRGWMEWANYGLKHISKGAFYFDLYRHSTFSCKIVPFIQHATMCISAWIIVCFSVERAYVVWFPLKRAAITPNIRKRVLYILCLVSTLAAVHRLVLFGIIDGNPKYCFYTIEPTIGTIIYQIDTALYNYLPCTTIFMANILILVAIFRSRGQDLRRSTHKTSTDGRLLLSLMLVSTTYVLLLMPYPTLFTYVIFNKQNFSEEYGVYLGDMLRIIVHTSTLNYCINFIIYGCTLSFYREEATKMFRITRSRQGDGVSR